MSDESRRGGDLARQVAALGPAFRQRLVRDRQQIEALLATAAAASDVPSPALRDVELAAHKLHGTSAMFGYEALGLAAGRLEAAARAAIASSLPGALAAQELERPHRELAAEIDAAVGGTPEGGPAN